MGEKFVSSEPMLSRTSLCSSLVSWKIYLCTCKNRLYDQHRNDYSIPHNIFAIEVWKKNVFCRIDFCDVCILWKECRIYFCDPNVQCSIFQPSLKRRYDIYGNNLCLSPCRRLCRVMNFLVYWKWWLYLYCIFYLVF